MGGKRFLTGILSREWHCRRLTPDRISSGDLVWVAGNDLPGFVSGILPSVMTVPCDALTRGDRGLIVAGHAWTRLNALKVILCACVLCL